MSSEKLAKEDLEKRCEERIDFFRIELIETLTLISWAIFCGLGYNEKFTY